MKLSDDHTAQAQADMLRPVRHQVRSGDQFFFLHIPKTAGMTMVSIFRQIFKGSDFFAAGGGEHMPVPPEIETARMVRAHRSYNFLKHYARPPLVVTMLRHPYKRMLSYYSFLSYMNRKRLQQLGKRVRQSGDDTSVATLEEFASLPDMRNVQTQFLSGIYPRSLEEEAELGKFMIEIAKIHLDSIAFFGLVERFDESLSLLQYTFDWTMIKPIKAQNVTPSSAKAKLAPEQEAILEDANRLDMELYEYAKPLFENRLLQMAKQQ